MVKFYFVMVLLGSMVIGNMISQIFIVPLVHP